MLSNVGHTIQKMINNTPIAVTTNDTTTSVVTNGGNVYQTGFIGNKIQHSFREIIANGNIVGKIIDAEAVEDSIYLLNEAGSVYQYIYGVGDCGSVVREVFSPAACGGDKAVQIKTGRAHVLIKTQGNKVYGAGSNDQYQLVPQGQCKYDTAVEILITDTNLHDNNCCTSFVGTYNELEVPIIPQCEKECNKISCVKKNLCDVLLGYLNISRATITPCDNRKDCHAGILGVPVYGDINYVGFLCVDSNGCASGSLTYSITRIYIKCGCVIAKMTTNDCHGCHVREYNISSTKEIVIFEADNCVAAKTDLCAFNNVTPITGTAQINGKCGACVIVNIDLPKGLALPTAAFDKDCHTVTLDLRKCVSSLTVLCDGAFTGLGNGHCINLDLDFDVPLDCCEPYQAPKPEVVLPQPCWANIYAGFNTSVLVDNCNRIYVLGSIHEIRSNKDLLKGSCLEELLNKTNASISFPADQLNCGGNRAVRNNNCPCNKCKDREFKTDLTKFGISLNFPQGDECKNMNVCDFLQSLKNCNEAQNCAPTCQPCDGYIYLNIEGNCGCPCGAPSSAPIGSVTLFNKKSICKLVSQGCPDAACVSVDVNTIVEFDLNKYCIDATDVPLDKILKLDFCTADGPNVNVYIDIDQPGGIKFTSEGKNCNVEFTVSATTQNHQFILNYGSILDPVELTNLKYALSLDAYYPCAKYKNPFDTKITNTYLRGGDRVRFVVGNPKNIRQAITADIPTVFRLNRRVIDVGVGANNLSILVGGLACPNEIFAIGNNCHGELGLGTNETVVCFKQLNRCQFDCQVNAIYSGRYVTFYVTQSYQIYAAGQYKCFVNSTSPAVVRQICQSWKIKYIAISANHLILLGSDGCIFGLGDNSMGELGLCHLECVKKPTPLAFFYKLNNGVAKQLSDNLSHPVEKNYRNNGRPNFNNNYDNYNDQDNYNNNNYNNGGGCSNGNGCNFKNRNPNKFFSKKYSPNGRISFPKYNKY